MRKVILQVAVSLDGLIEGPNGEYDWCFTDQDYGMSEFMSQVDTMFVGRKSYELIVRMGPDAMPAFPKLKEYIFSTTLREVPPDATLISENVEAEVRRIKNESGKDIWLFGGASLAASLLKHNLIDEMRLAVHPIILSAGKPLFTGMQNRLPLTLTDSKTYSSGLVSLTYTIT